MYKYYINFNTYNDISTISIVKIKLDVEEKPNSYKLLNSYGGRILKNKLDIPSGYNDEYIYSLEDNIEKYGELLINEYKRKLDNELQTQIRYCENAENCLKLFNNAMSNVNYKEEN